MNGAAAEPLRFRIEPTEQDWIAANWLILRYRWRPSVSLPYLVAGCVAIGLMSAARGVFAYGWSTPWTLYNFAWGAGYGALVFAAMIIVMVVLLPRGVRRRYAEARKLSSGADVVIDSKGVSYDMAYAQLALTWDQLKCWYENARTLIMAVNAGQTLLLPKSQLDPATIDAVRHHLINANVKRGLT